MSGDEETQWHSTAYALDLTKDPPVWKPISPPPFQRRALALAAHQGKLFVIGGMQRAGGPTTRVDVYDPATDQWTQGPDLIGEGMDGFGASAFATGGKLYVSTYSGSLQRLAADGSAWEMVSQLERARFFHRLLPLHDHALLSIGGASMSEGKFAEIDLIHVP
jgi:hypothetical protein